MTAGESDAAGAGDQHGAEKRERERVVGHRENPADESSVVGDEERGAKASGVAENLKGDCQGEGGGG